MTTPDRSKLLEKVRALPHKPGVYLMKDRLGTVIYVGKAKDLNKRVSTYFQPSRRRRWEQPKVTAMIPLIYDLETVEVRSEPEALLLEGKLIKQYRPKYNTDFTDDKRFLLVRLDMEADLPRFRLCRVQTDERSRYFGPFAHSGLLRKTLAEMRKRFGVLLGDAKPTPLPDGAWLLYDDVRGEIYGHPNIVTAEQYLLRLEGACDFLEGKSREWLSDLKEQMAIAAQEMKYEKAAELRDIVQAIERTLTPTRKFVRNPVGLSTAALSASILEQLGKHLELPEPPETMECFDISHISGTFCVASMVRFVNGQPDKAGYRRFKIQSFVGNDDFRAMQEVVGRRYRRLNEEGKPYPHLVIIDGGLGQVSAALKAFMEADLPPPPLIGLAKKEEAIIFADGREPLYLPHSNPALQLLQRIRDEAHRFANSFNAELRSKKLRETILNDFEGLGPVRRNALLDHFKSLDALRKASIEELREVEGIGPKLAADLKSFLEKAMPSNRPDPLTG